ncbi:uncharacterized protein [Physcomitrium patens]|uniref:uncharacterized protein isoform X3 n=1 Tax=Physcomitrium patens TaxID=3218 RepID=UPI003CCDABA1
MEWAGADHSSGSDPRQWAEVGSWGNGTGGESKEVFFSSDEFEAHSKVFHVLHSACLIERVAFCKAKTWNASLTMSRKLKRQKTVH